MKSLLSLALTLVPLLSQTSSAAPPDLSKLSSLEVLRLGLNKTEKIDGKCYQVSHNFCEVGTTPKDCIANDVIESKTNTRLDKMKFVLSSRTRDTDNQEILIYKGVPISPKEKEENLYIIRREKIPSPIRFFVTLKESPCDITSLTSNNLVLPNQQLSQKPESPTAQNSITNSNKVYSQPNNSVAIPLSENQRKAALNFLLQRPPQKVDE